MAIWAKRSIRGEDIPFHKFDRIEVCLVKLSGIGILVCAVYLPPGLTSSIFVGFKERLEIFLDNFLFSFPHCRVMIAGDFNRYDMSFLSQKVFITRHCARSNTPECKFGSYLR